ncbi:MAG TPA: acyl-ACP thioesterase domain-containing protein [Streptosporangiaceae bacterium]|nr:acyl-ACP thioesterase domain-containing protein [Streptosporangiaceae bacterium]
MPQATTTSALPFTPEPPDGRVYEGHQLVRSIDVRPDGRFRFDALARALQEVAVDDVTDTGWRAPYTWLLRRCAITVHGYPRFGGKLTLRTFCSATGPRWAQRTTIVAGADGPLIQSVAIWAAVDLATGQPVPLGEDFFQYYGPATQGQKVSARLSLPKPPHPGATEARPWPLRAADFDPAGHANNAIAWAAVEDVLAMMDWLPALAEMEYHRPMLPGCTPRLMASAHDGAGDREVFAWLMDGDERLATARLYSPAPPR